MAGSIRPISLVSFSEGDLAALAQCLGPGADAAQADSGGLEADLLAVLHVTGIAHDGSEASATWHECDDEEPDHARLRSGFGRMFRAANPLDPAVCTRELRPELDRQIYLRWTARWRRDGRSDRASLSAVDWQTLSPSEREEIRYMALHLQKCHASHVRANRPMKDDIDTALVLVAEVFAEHSKYQGDHYDLPHSVPSRFIRFAQLALRDCFDPTEVSMSALSQRWRRMKKRRNTLSDLYLRDHVGHTGDPHGGPISASPDIILRPVAVADPMAAFGEGSGTENSASLSFEAIAGQDNFIYVRCRNRGGSAATNVTAQVFWSPVSTLVTPDLWTPVGAGSVAIADVPVGDILTSSQALTWPATEIPAAGHYCFVGILDSDDDPAPAPADFGDFDSFRHFIRNNNNVTSRNFNVIASDPEEQVVLPWIMPGAPDRQGEFALELTLRLPKKAEVLWTLPLSFLHDFKAQLPLVEIDKKGQRATAKLPPAARLVFGPALLPKKTRYDMRFAVRVMSKDGARVHRLEARQLFEGKEEVGRVCWLFDPKAGPQFRTALAEGSVRRPARRQRGACPDRSLHRQSYLARAPTPI